MFDNFSLVLYFCFPTWTQFDDRYHPNPFVETRPPSGDGRKRKRPQAHTPCGGVPEVRSGTRTVSNKTKPTSAHVYGTLRQGSESLFCPQHCSYPPELLITGARATN